MKREKVQGCDPAHPPSHPARKKEMNAPPDDELWKDVRQAMEKAAGDWWRKSHPDKTCLKVQIDAAIAVVVERCAKVADGWTLGDPAAEHIAAAIRALAPKVLP